jgi:hypothetical protein
MNQNIVSAVFDTHSEAERAVADLRATGVSDDAISIIAQHDGKNTTTDGSGADNEGDNDGLVKGLVGGAGLGALAGIAALAIPGVGPFVAAGAIAQNAIGGAAVTGAALGATAGGLAGALTDHGLNEEDARYYEGRVNSGGVFVSVDTSRAGISPTSALDLMNRSGGHASGRAKMVAAL